MERIITILDSWKQQSAKLKTKTEKKRFRTSKDDFLYHLVLQFCQSVIKLLLCFLKNRHLFKKGTVKRHDILWVEKC